MGFPVPFFRNSLIGWGTLDGFDRIGSARNRGISKNTLKRLAILGSTGSIGQSTLSIVEQFPDRYSVAALAAGRNLDEAFVVCQFLEKG